MRVLYKLKVSEYILILALIGESLGPIAKAVGYATYSSKLSGTLEVLMKDESSEVRLGVCKSLYDIFMASDKALLSSTQTLLVPFMKDTQYRIRERLIETLSLLGAEYGLEIFIANFESLYFNYIIDTVNSVRETGIRSLEVLI
jgi:hypothetical protein